MLTAVLLLVGCWGSPKNDEGVAVGAAAAAEPVDGIAKVSKVLSTLNETHAGPVAKAKIEEAARRFEQVCAGCHGGPGGEAVDLPGDLEAKAPDLRQHGDDDRSDQAVFNRLRKGEANSAMNGVAHDWSDEEVWAMVAYVQGLGTESAAVEPATAE